MSQPQGCMAHTCLYRLTVKDWPFSSYASTFNPNLGFDLNPSSILEAIDSIIWPMSAANFKGPLRSMSRDAFKPELPRASYRRPLRDSAPLDQGLIVKFPSYFSLISRYQSAYISSAISIVLAFLSKSKLSTRFVDPYIVRDRTVYNLRASISYAHSCGTASVRTLWNPLNNEPVLHLVEACLIFLLYSSNIVASKKADYSSCEAYSQTESVSSTCRCNSRLEPCQMVILRCDAVEPRFCKVCLSLLPRCTLCR